MHAAARDGGIVPATLALLVAALTPQAGASLQPSQRFGDSWTFSPSGSIRAWNHTGDYNPDDGRARGVQFSPRVTVFIVDDLAVELGVAGESFQNWDIAWHGMEPSRARKTTVRIGVSAGLGYNMWLADSLSVLPVVWIAQNNPVDVSGWFDLRDDRFERTSTTLGARVMFLYHLGSAYVCLGPEYWYDNKGSYGDSRQRQRELSLSGGVGVWF
jgi:hypothetical protein